MIQWFLTLVAPSLLLVSGEFSITQESLDSVATEAVSAFNRVSEKRLEKTPAFRIVMRDELYDIVYKELLPQITAQVGSVEGEGSAKSMSLALSEALLAKYVPDSDTIVVCAKNFESLARGLDTPGLRTRNALVAVLVHECVHALDSHRFKWAEKIEEISSDTERLLAFNAVLEGHAQFVARRICSESGWTDGFEAFTSCIGKIVGEDAMGEGMKILSRVVTAGMASAYIDGETFMAAIHEKGGDKLVVRAFTTPPVDVETIAHPEWFIAPDSRPSYVFDLSRAAERVSAGFDKSVWTAQAMSVGRPQLQAALALLSPEEITQILDSMRQNKTVVLVPTAAPQSKMVAGAFFEFATALDARQYFASSEKLVRLKDERMKSGMIRILDSEYSEVRRNGWQGLYFVKTASVGAETVKVSSVVAVRGKVGAEVIFSNEMISKEKVIELLDACFAEVLAVD